MDPFTGAMLANAIPVIGGMFMGDGNRPSGPDYSAAMAYMNSPELLAYRNSMLRSAYDPQSDIYQQASNQALAQSNRIAASRGLGTSGAGIGFAQNTQNDLAQKFQQGEFQRRLQAYQAAIGGAQSQVDMMMNMANSQYKAQMGNYYDDRKGQAALLSGIRSMVNNGVSAYNYNQNKDALDSSGAGYAARMDGPPPAGMVFNTPIYGRNYNYGFGGK